MSDDTPWGSPRPGDAPKPDKDAPTASDPLKEGREAWSTPAPFIKSEVPESAETAQRTFDEAAEKVKEAAKKVTRKVGARKNGQHDGQHAPTDGHLLAGHATTNQDRPGDRASARPVDLG